MWGLTVQELTQTCDVTMKDEYMYLSQRRGGAERGEREERERSICRETDRQTYIICRERETEIERDTERERERERSICRDLILLKN